jgi:hypothetical protein
MKKITSCILAVSVIFLTTMTSCEKENYSTSKETVKASPDEFPIWLAVVAAAYVIVELSEGQYSSSTTTNPDGSSTTTTNCTGVGSCSAPSIVNSGTGNSLNTVEASYTGDYFLEGYEIVKTESGQVLFGTDISNPDMEIFFDSEDEVYLSHPIVLDAPDFMEEFGLEEPIVFGGYYSVYTAEDTRYIILQE